MNVEAWVVVVVLAGLVAAATNVWDSIHKACDPQVRTLLHLPEHGHLPDVLPTP